MTKVAQIGYFQLKIEKVSFTIEFFYYYFENINIFIIMPKNKLSLYI